MTAQPPCETRPAPFVSILIVNYNGASLLRPCLDSVRQITKPSFEVIVVDNASKDDSLEVLKEYPWVKCVVSQTNRGFAGGNNLGLPHCTGDLILLLNSDTIVTPDFLQVLCDHLEKHPEAGLVQPRMLLPNHGNRLDSCGSFMTRFGFMYHYGFLKPDSGKYHISYPVFSAKGACLLLRRDVIQQAGGYLFDEEYFCYYEETDLCHRAWLAGIETHYVGSTAIKHLMGATSTSSQSRAFVMDHFLRNQLFSLAANLQPPTLCWLMPCYLLVFGSSLAGAVLTGKWLLARSHVRAVEFVLARLRKLMRQREVSRKIRRWSDREIFRRTLRHPSWRYFLRTFQGRLDAFVDQPLPGPFAL